MAYRITPFLMILRDFKVSHILQAFLNAIFVQCVAVDKVNCHRESRDLSVTAEPIDAGGYIALLTVGDGVV